VGRARVIRSHVYVRMPWKNGGGETAEIAVGPAGAALAQFDWRISMARVATDGPFSTFPGVDRTLAVVAGAGLRLSVHGHSPIDLRIDSAPIAFPGDASTHASLISGEILDFNVMTRLPCLRRQCAHNFLRPTWCSARKASSTCSRGISRLAWSPTIRCCVTTPPERG
jgi:environmental stress-induced protein Ves